MFLNLRPWIPEASNNSLITCTRFFKTLNRLIRLIFLKLLELLLTLLVLCSERPQVDELFSMSCSFDEDNGDEVYPVVDVDRDF